MGKRIASVAKTILAMELFSVPVFTPERLAGAWKHGGWGIAQFRDIQGVPSCLLKGNIFQRPL
jgi:hypothetical protein